MLFEPFDQIPSVVAFFLMTNTTGSLRFRSGIFICVAADLVKSLVVLVNEAGMRVDSRATNAGVPFLLGCHDI